MTILKEQLQTAREEVTAERSLGNFYRSPRLSKITLNVGLGALHSDSRLCTQVERDLALIAGQKPVPTRAKKSIAGFKIRDGMVIGSMVTLRGQRMVQFADRLIHVVLPRIRDFRGLSEKSFDKQGNYTFGISDHTVFPEISLAEGETAFPLQLTLTFETMDAEASRELLRKIQFPFRR